MQPLRRSVIRKVKLSGGCGRWPVYEVEEDEFDVWLLGLAQKEGATVLQDSVVRPRDIEHAEGRYHVRAGGETHTARVLVGAELTELGLNHPRTGDVVLVSLPNSWQAYYWWWSDAAAPRYARTVDIHRKPGYDPVELFWGPDGVPLDATRVKGSHGAPANGNSEHAVILASRPGLLGKRPGAPAAIADTDVAGIVLGQFAH